MPIVKNSFTFAQIFNEKSDKLQTYLLIFCYNL